MRKSYKPLSRTSTFPIKKDGIKLDDDKLENIDEWWKMNDNLSESFHFSEIGEHKIENFDPSEITNNKKRKSFDAEYQNEIDEVYLEGDDSSDQMNEIDQIDNNNLSFSIEMENELNQNLGNQNDGILKDLINQNGDVNMNDDVNQNGANQNKRIHDNPSNQNERIHDNLSNQNDNLINQNDSLSNQSLFNGEGINTAFDQNEIKITAVRSNNKKSKVEPSDSTDKDNTIYRNNRLNMDTKTKQNTKKIKNKGPPQESNPHIKKRRETIFKRDSLIDALIAKEPIKKIRKSKKGIPIEINKERIGITNMSIGLEKIKKGSDQGSNPSITKSSINNIINNDVVNSSILQMTASAQIKNEVASENILFLILKGEITIEIKNKEFRMEQGGVILIRRGDVYSVECLKKSVISMTFMFN